jgi:hypothetical protein
LQKIEDAIATINTNLPAFAVGGAYRRSNFAGTDHGAGEFESYDCD